MSRERRQELRRRRNIEKQQQRRRAGRMVVTGASGTEPYEFGGFMGWMQRNTKWLFLGGIVVMVLSLGGSSLLSRNPTTPTPTPTPVASATETPAPTPTGSTTPTSDPAIKRTYPKAPEMAIDVNHTFEAIIRPKKGGEIHVQLDPKSAPIHTNNFVFLARNRFFDGLTFHRVLPGFVAQGGDPLGTGFGGPGYTLPPEKNGVKFDPGVISMASSSAGVSGSQFFITLAATPSLQGQFSVFGKVTQGMDVLQQITLRDPSQPNQPAADIIDKIEIVEK